jgi:hypothetical protein
MVTKAEAEPVIRHLARAWYERPDIGADDREHPSFTRFVAWVRDQGHGTYLEFRSTIGPLDDAERWFDDTLGQNWRR